jgi:hypothetical protein
VRKEDGGRAVVDFKTGQAKPEHKEQVLLYAVLWLRCREEIPRLLQVRYFDTVVELTPSRQLVLDAEKRLRDRIDAVRHALATPVAGAKSGSHCGICSVRQFCDDYWRGKKYLSSATKPAFVDEELVVAGLPSESGFAATRSDEGETHVVFEARCGDMHGPFAQDETLRVLGGVRVSPEELRLTATSEVFHR